MGETEAVLRIGLTGGMGAGKSTVAKVLADCGAVIIDSDAIAREVVEPGTPGLAALVEAFGDDILADDGSLNRPALAAKAFGSEESRQKLNSITHPLVGKRTAELLAAVPVDGIVVQDIPLLVEGKLGSLFNLVLIVFVDAEERVRRLVEHRGVPEDDARARIALQATDDQRRATADVWLDNSGAAGALDAEVRRVWDNRIVPFERNLREGVVVRTHPEVVQADPQWPVQAERLISRLRVVSAESAIRIDHIGSTAVPGLDAKDVIDLQITVRDMETADALATPLNEAGFPRIESIGDDDPKPIGGTVDSELWVKRIHGGADPERPVNVHIRVEGLPGQQFALAFRDWLRADAQVRDEYLAVKQEAGRAAAAHSDYQDAIKAYVDAKSPWFATAYERCLQWIGETGWQA